jgi:phosphoribosylglycinamide formyltransferase-1
MDDGEIIAQRCLPILKTDTFESYKKRVHAVEHEIYPEAVLEALGLS